MLRHLDRHRVVVFGQHPASKPGRHNDRWMSKCGPLSARPLSQTEERLALATQSAGIGIWDWDVVRDVMLWDDRTCELYGVASGFPASYSAWQACPHPDDRARVVLAATAALKGAAPFNVEYRVV